MAWYIFDGGAVCPNVSMRVATGRAQSEHGESAHPSYCGRSVARRICRFVKLVQPRQFAAFFGLFDHLVGPAKQRERNGDAECLRGLHVDDQVDLGRLLDWQIRWPFPIENTRDVNSGKLVALRK